MNYKEAIVKLKCMRNIAIGDAYREVLDYAIQILESGGWHPVRTEKISDKEKYELAKKYDMSPEDWDDCWKYVGEMPEDGQECLITTGVWKYVCIDTFHIDEDGAMYFEEHEDEDEVIAWMPLPKSFKSEEQDE